MFSLSCILSPFTVMFVILVYYLFNIIVNRSILKFYSCHYSSHVAKTAIWNLIQISDDNWRWSMGICL